MDYYRIAHMLLNLMILFHLLSLHLAAKRRIPASETATGCKTVTLEVTDHGAVDNNRMRILIHKLMGHHEVQRLTLGLGSYLIGSNAFATFFPRCIALVDSSGLSFKVAAVVKSAEELQLSVLDGYLTLNGVTYETDPDTILNIHRNESFWLGQAEIKMK